MDQDRRAYTIAIAAAVLAIVLSLCVGAFAGGAAGYLAARTAGRQMRQELLDVLRDWQSRQVQPQPFDPDRSPGLPLSGGAIVTQVVEGGPADRAGIREGDVILAVDDVRIDQRNSLREVISRRAPGERVVVVLWRQGRDRQVTLRLGEHPEQEGVPYVGVFYEMLPTLPEPFGED